MSLTMNDWMMLIPLLVFAGFVSYTVHEVSNAIRSMLHEEDSI